MAKDKTNAIIRQEVRPTGVISLSGVVRMTELRQQFTPKNVEDSSRWHCRDIDRLAYKLDTLPIFIDADDRSTVQGGPIGGQTRVTMRNEHLSYMITWYSLSAITAYMCIKRFLK